MPDLTLFPQGMKHVFVTNTKCICPDTLGSQPDTYLVPVNYVMGLGVRHIDAISIY